MRLAHFVSQFCKPEDGPEQTWKVHYLEKIRQLFYNKIRTPGIIRSNIFFRKI